MRPRPKHSNGCRSGQTRRPPSSLGGKRLLLRLAVRQFGFYIPANRRRHENHSPAALVHYVRNYRSHKQEHSFNVDVLVLIPAFFLSLFLPTQPHPDRVGPLRSHPGQKPSRRPPEEKIPSILLSQTSQSVEPCPGVDRTTKPSLGCPRLWTCPR